jgi:hypothetical protein
MDKLSVFFIILHLVISTHEGLPQGTPLNNQATVSPKEPHGTVPLSITTADSPNDLRELISVSDLIIQARVESVLDVRFVNPNSRDLIETDFELIVNRVLKAKTDDTNQKGKRVGKITVSQLGGKMGDFEVVPAQYKLMEPGEDYILFLRYDDRVSLTTVNDLRCVIRGSWHGSFLIDRDKSLKVSSDSIFNGVNENKKTIDELIVEILETQHRWMKEKEREN